jgi:hypothetical protein
MYKLLTVLLAAVPAAAQLPEFYKTVDRVVWVVGDVNRVTEAWTKTGLLKVQKRADSSAGNRRVFSGWLGNLYVDWIQPLESGGAYGEFLKKHGDGIFAVLHRPSSVDAFDAEIERLRALGVAVLERGDVQGARYVCFDTAAQGKYVLGLVYGGETPGPAPEQHRVNQLAFTARDLQPISAYWEKLGFPRMAVNRAALTDLRYRGQPAEIQQSMGWYRHGKIPYEWILPLNGRNIFEDYMNQHGEGFHHLGHPVEDMDRAIAEWEAAGFRVTQSGAWGQAGQKGSGRFAYLDTEKIGGVALELLWNFREGKP